MRTLKEALGIAKHKLNTGKTFYFGNGEYGIMVDENGIEWVICCGKYFCKLDEYTVRY